ncbi:hypothetical protein K3725_06245 [Leisingera sp. S132]|uniref:hypothetical protein n=1 Tax=Leisingera sp. S132 TaxID=2867016 RepID=UPI0021A5895D|nr:hypothetical protein [Leisingera sp. S132]UWQ80601.1 hypothetical protein K3725_06245 [Leisingera sp. S132]
MTSNCETAGIRPRRTLARNVFGWIAGLTGLRKTEPFTNAPRKTVRVPRRDMERLSEISPHLLADIGVVPAGTAEDTSPWRLQDGRHLLLRPPL